MKNIIRRGGRAISGALLCGALLFGTATAAPAPATDGMAALREVLSAQTSLDNRVFRQAVRFFVPAVRADVDMQGYMKGKTLRLLGDAGLVFTHDNGTATELKCPFYLEQKDKDISLYFKPDKKWRKCKVPPMPASFAEMAETSGAMDNETLMTLVREAVVLRETDTQRTLRIRPDGERMAAFVMQFCKANLPAGEKPEDIAWQNAFLDCISEGLRRSDIGYTWTVDKKDGRTVMLSCDLTSFVQETARVALETQQAWPDDVQRYIESVAYHSDLKFCTTFLTPEARKRITLPEEAKQAVEMEEVIPNEVTGTEK